MKAEAYDEFEESSILKLNETPKNDRNKTLTTVVSYDVENANEIKERINKYLEECSDGSFRCILCGKISNINSIKGDQRKTIRRHIETHLEGLTYSCPICQKTTRSYNSLAKHKSLFHKS